SVPIEKNDKSIDYTHLDLFRTPDNFEPISVAVSSHFIDALSPDYSYSNENATSGLIKDQLNDIFTTQNSP
ncbi:MAG: hypothetical protein MHPSP_001194, partial [Paramarteilia canceri]